MSKKAVDILYASPLDQTHWKKLTEIIVSTNRRDKARNERLPDDCCVVAAVQVCGVREGEERGGENGENLKEGWKVFAFASRLASAVEAVTSWSTRGRKAKVGAHWQVQV